MCIRDRLETVRVSRAAADQRRGRAGRIEPGLCYRLWDEPQTAALEPFARPETVSYTHLDVYKRQSADS